MIIWDLDEKLLFPAGALTAYVKNILHFAGSPVRVDSLIRAHVNHYLFSGFDRDGRPAEFIAPFACRSRIGETYIPFVFQRSYLRGDYRWSSDASSNKGCMKIAEQRDGREFKLVASRYAFLRFARSGKPRNYQASLTYAADVRDYIAKELDKNYMTEQFRFVEVVSRREAVVPYQPTVLNHPEPEEIYEARPRHLSATQRLALPAF